MRIVGVRRPDGSTYVGDLAEDGLTVTVLAGLEDFGQTPSPPLSQAAPPPCHSRSMTSNWSRRCCRAPG